MNYTFFISYGGTNVTQVYPLNWLECSLIDEKERDQVFYRRKFQGALTFGAGRIAVTEESGSTIVSYLCEDYDLFNDIRIADPCTRIELLILNGLDIYYEAYFSISQGEWDFDNKLFTITPLPTDDYFDWVEEGDFEYDILSLTLAVDSVYDDGATTTIYSRTRLLSDVIQKLAEQVFGVGITVTSTFFSLAINPITRETNRYDKLTIAQKSDIKYPTSSNPAAFAMLSFNGLMEILKCMNLKWKYDGNFNILTIEHISNWDSYIGLDIRTQEMTLATNKYKYLKEIIPKYEHFNWMESKNDDFVGKPIWYDSQCVNQDHENNKTEYIIDVTTDIEYLRDCIALNEDSKISNEGWVLFANEEIGGVLYIRSNSGIIDFTDVLFNMDLSWGRLHEWFFKHDRQLIEGYMNGIFKPFYSARKIKVQECSIIYCDTFNPEQNITTELGETYFGGEKGDIKRTVIKPYGEINLTLIYGPENIDIPVPIPTKILRVTEGACGHLYAQLSPAADDDLDIVITYILLNASCIGIGGGGPLTWTIPLGATIDDYDMSALIPPGGYIEIYENFADPMSKGWTCGSIVRSVICLCT